MKNLILGITLSVIACSNIHSQDSVATNKDEISMITNRPGATEASRAVFHKGFQIEMGLEYGKIPSRKGSSEHSQYLYLPNLGLQYGVSKNVELRVFFTNYGTRSNINGGLTQYVYNVNSVDVGAKINIYQGKNWVPEMALLVNQGIPTNPSDNCQTWPTSAVLAWSHSLPVNLSISGILGYIGTIDKCVDFTTYDAGWKYSLNLGYLLKPNVGVFAEIFGEDQFSDNSAVPLTIDGGVWYRFNPKLQIDASAGYGNSVGNYYVNVGLSWLMLK